MVIGGGSFIGYTPIYKPPTVKDLCVIFNPSASTIISSNIKVITMPAIIVDNIEYLVKVIDKEVYQALGLISVVLSSELERTEDYAFAGNQLEGVAVPNHE